MIIFGTNTGLIKFREMPKVQCQICQVTGHVKMSRYVKYTHLFWIPTFPYGSTGLSQCDNCETILDYDEMSRDTQNHFQHFKEFARLPIWSFAGSILVLLFISWGIISENRDDGLTRDYANAPLKGDVLYLKQASNSYSTIRVSGVIGNSILVNFNEFGTNKESSLKELDNSSKYSQDTMTISKAYLMGMLDSEQIVKIIRN